jgi:hypothetical protein
MSRPAARWCQSAEGRASTTCQPVRHGRQSGLEGMQGRGRRSRRAIETVHGTRSGYRKLRSEEAPWKLRSRQRLDRSRSRRDRSRGRRTNRVRRCRIRGRRHPRRTRSRFRRDPDRRSSAQAESGRTPTARRGGAQRSLNSRPTRLVLVALREPRVTEVECERQRPDAARAAPVDRDEPEDSQSDRRRAWRRRRSARPRPLERERRALRMFGPRCGVTRTASTSGWGRAAASSQSGGPFRERSAKAMPGRSAAAASSRG